MTTPKIAIHNVNTGEVVERDMTAEEVAQLAKDKAASDALIAAETKAAADKAALLSKLGITEDEARLLLS
jgi:hypothetical protein